MNLVIWTEVPGTRFAIAEHAGGCHCPAGERCAYRPPDVEPPLHWMWWGSGFVLMWGHVLGARSRDAMNDVEFRS